MVQDLAPAFDGIEVAITTGGGAANGQMQDYHTDDCDDEAEDAFPADNLEGFEGVLLQDPFLEDELGGSEYLGHGDHQDADDCVERSRELGFGLDGFQYGTGDLDAFVDVRARPRLRLWIWCNGSGETDDGNADDDDEECGPLVQSQSPM